MHTIKLLLTYYLNISVQAANLLDCRIESNRNFFRPNWNYVDAHQGSCVDSRRRGAFDRNLRKEFLFIYFYPC